MKFILSLAVVNLQPPLAILTPLCFKTFFTQISFPIVLIQSSRLTADLQ